MCNHIVLDPQFDLNEVIIHEGAHTFYGRFGIYEGNIHSWTKPMLTDPRYKRVAQKHIVRTIPEDLHWELEDLDVYTRNIGIIADGCWVED
jgi:hypothetical protein